MYTTYSTESIIFGRDPHGEADLSIELFTKEFGIVRATAAGARLEQSKLRYALQVGAVSTVALVSGKRIWRITGAELLEASPSEGQISRFARALLLVRTMLQKEEPSPEVYSLVRTYALALTTNTDELAFVASLLTILGYLYSPQAHKSVEVLYDAWHTQATNEHKRTLLLVNNSLAANHISQK